MPLKSKQQKATVRTSELFLQWHADEMSAFWKPPPVTTNTRTHTHAKVQVSNALRLPHQLYKTWFIYLLSKCGLLLRLHYTCLSETAVGGKWRATVGAGRDEVNKTRLSPTIVCEMCSGWKALVLVSAPPAYRIHTSDACFFFFLCACSWAHNVAVCVRYSGCTF